ncbi:MAG: CYTH domain-containing protein, partial [Aldersonia sp.]|nr:CYTH domain-containing protein [Aldersonia sp.]
MPEYVEREDKYDVADDFVVPDLVTAVGGRRRKHAEYRLVNTYYDTPRGALRARGLTLRRREGGGDEGWQLKIPQGDSRVELQEPLGDGSVIPDRLNEVLAGVLLGETPEPVVQM